MIESSGTIGWLDCSSGVSGDMLLGALTELEVVRVPELARTLGVKGWFAAGGTARGGIRATTVEIQAADDQPHRRLFDVQRIIDRAEIPAPVKVRATAVFRRLAAAEATVHGRSPDQVEFHEVGAV
ncbi:MAG TPA: nickel insertion protein, partial [Mycobacteriales bacterium]|nr:nickel insertion protein [Mycobacteriales bacterium]